MRRHEGAVNFSLEVPLIWPILPNVGDAQKSTTALSSTKQRVSPGRRDGPSPAGSDARRELVSKENGIRRGMSSNRQTGVMIRPAQRASLAVLATAVITVGSRVPAQGAEQVLDSIHFLMPGGAGGGWDGTACGTGEAVTKSGIIVRASYENMSGSGSRKATGYLIENAESNCGTLMVNSTPIIIRSLSRPVSGRGSCAYASTATGFRSPSTERKCFPENSTIRGPVTPFRWYPGRTRSRCLPSTGPVSRELLAAMRT